jgi:hypothetical protein
MLVGVAAAGVAGVAAGVAVVEAAVVDAAGGGVASGFRAAMRHGTAVGLGVTAKRISFEL